MKYSQVDFGTVLVVVVLVSDGGCCLCEWSLFDHLSIAAALTCYLLFRYIHITSPPFAIISHQLLVFAVFAGTFNKKLTSSQGPSSIPSFTGWFFNWMNFSSNMST